MQYSSIGFDSFRSQWACVVRERRSAMRLHAALGHRRHRMGTASWRKHCSICSHRIQPSNTKTFIRESFTVEYGSIRDKHTLYGVHYIVSIFFSWLATPNIHAKSTRQIFTNFHIFPHFQYGKLEDQNYEREKNSLGKEIQGDQGKKEVLLILQYGRFIQHKQPVHISVCSAAREKSMKQPFAFEFGVIFRWRAKIIQNILKQTQRKETTTTVE